MTHMFRVRHLSRPESISGNLGLLEYRLLGRRAPSGRRTRAAHATRRRRRTRGTRSLRGREAAFGTTAPPTRAAALSLSSSHARPSHTRCSMAAVAPPSTSTMETRERADVRRRAPHGAAHATVAVACTSACDAIVAPRDRARAPVAIHSSSAIARCARARRRLRLQRSDVCVRRWQWQRGRRPTPRRDVIARRRCGTSPAPRR